MCYQHSGDVTATWDAASAACEAAGSMLATSKSKEKNDFLMALAGWCRAGGPDLSDLASGGGGLGEAPGH